MAVVPALRVICELKVGSAGVEPRCMNSPHMCAMLDAYKKRPDTSGPQVADAIYFHAARASLGRLYKLLILLAIVLGDATVELPHEAVAVFKICQSIAPSRALEFARVVFTAEA